MIVLSRFSVLVLALVGHVVSCCASPPDSFRKSLIENIGLVDAWQIEYETIIPPSAKDTSALHFVVALKEPNCIYQWASKYRHGSKQTSQWYPLQQRIIVAEDREYWEFPMRRAFRLIETDDKHLFRGSLPLELLWPAIAWWPITRESNSMLDDEPYVVVDALDSDDYHFRSELEMASGRPCWVLESPSRSVLWFDSERIGVLVAREFYGEENGVLQWRIEMSKHKEIRTGIWCPMELRNIQFDFNSPTKKGQNRRLVDVSYRVLDVRLDEDVPSELFVVPEPKPGSIQSSLDGTYEQIIPGGYDYLDEIAEWIEQNVSRDKNYVKFSFMEMIFYIVVCCISFVAIIHCRRLPHHGCLSDTSPSPKSTS